MKSNIIILFFFFFACSSNKQLQFDKSNCNFNDEISENEKIIDIKPYVKGKGGWLIIENDTIEIRAVPDSDGWRKYSYNKKTNIEKHIIYNAKTLKVINSFSFYKQGYFYIGNEYIYNEQGQVIKTIDHNQYNKYPICYKEISNVILKKSGLKYTLHALYRDSTKIDENKYKYSWNVYIDPVDGIFDSTKINSFKVDAVTGEIIKKWITISTPD